MVSKYLICFIFILLSACASTPGPRERDYAQLHTQMGNGHFEKGDYPRALNEFLIALKLDPTNAVIHNNIGLAYSAQKRYLLAIRHLKKALELSPQYTEARNNLARIQIDFGDYKPARTNLQIVFKDLTFPHPQRAWLNLGLLEFKLDNFQQAQVAFLTALRLDDSSCFAYTYYARSTQGMKEYRQAIPMYEKAIQLCGKGTPGDILYYSALNLFQAGDRLRAQSRLESYLEKYPLSENRQRAQNLLETIQR